MILDSKNIKYEVVDITEPTLLEEKDFMLTNATEKGITVSDTDPRHPLPPQIFNGTDYCGDYNSFELANECDTLEQFLKIEAQQNGSGSNSAAAVTTKTTATNGNENGTKAEEPASVVEPPTTEEETPASAADAGSNGDAPEPAAETVVDAIADPEPTSEAEPASEASADGGDASAGAGGDD